MTHYPPDPLKSKPFDVAAWYKTKVFVCAPFDIDSSFMPFCPRCNGTQYSHRGWSGFRRVVDVDRVCHAVTRRYLCKNGACGVEYLAWDQDILSRAPAHIRLTFPVILTHRLAVTEAVFELMRSCLDAGTGPGPYTSLIQEQHRRRYDRCRLAYMARVSALRNPPQTGQESMHALELKQEPPVFSAFDDPEGFGGICVSAKYLRTMYTFCMGILEGHMKRKNARVTARILSGDHFFKILRCNFTFGGSRSFEAAYSLVNEHSEVVAVVLTQSKSLEEIRQMLNHVVSRMVALGLPNDHVTLFYTDNPVAEKNFLLSIFEGLRRRGDGPAPLPLLSLPTDHIINLISSHADINPSVRLLRDDLEAAARAGKERVIGMDSEWTVSRQGRRRWSTPTQVLQLSTANRSLVIHVARSGMSHELKALLSAPDILKVGRGIAGDVHRLKKHFSITVVNFKDVGAVGKELGVVPRANYSLQAMCEQVLGVSLDKVEQAGHWGGDLTRAQILYASKDAYSCWSMYDKMIAAGSRFIDPHNLTPNAPVIVMDASGVEQVAKATIAAVQPAPPSRRVVDARRRVLVNVQEVFVPAFVLPFVRPTLTTLGDLWANAAVLRGAVAAFEVPCRQLRDANHPMEQRVVREQRESPRVAAIGPNDGVLDAREEVTIPSDRLRAMMMAGGAGGFQDDEGGDSDVGEAENDALDEDADLPELDLDLADAEDWVISGVKADPMHVMDRVLRLMPKNHGALALFSRRLSQAIFLFNLKDAMAAKAVAAKLWPNTPWAQILFRRTRWLNKRVRRFIPAPGVLKQRLEAVFEEFSDIVDASTGSQLFTPAAVKAYKAVLKLAECGAVSDDPDVPLYSLLSLDKDKLPLWLCCRGTNVNEGGVHQKLVKNFLSMKGASPELVYFALLEWLHRNNMRAATRNRGVDFPGHYDTWLVDALCKLEEELYGRRLSFPSWQCADDFSLPHFCCGVLPIDRSVLDKLGLPVGEKLEKVRTLLDRVSSQKKWLARAMGSVLPLLPVHTLEDIKIYHDTHKRLVEAEEARRTLAQPSEEAVILSANCEPSVEQLTVAINETVTARWVQAADADDRPAPTAFFKTFDHVRMYEARYEKSRNVMSTLVVHGPQLRRDEIAANQSYVRFGQPAATMDAVHPIQTGLATDNAVGAGSGGGAASAPDGSEAAAASGPAGAEETAAAGAAGAEGGGGAAVEISNVVRCAFAPPPRDHAHIGGEGSTDDAVGAHAGDDWQPANATADPLPLPMRRQGQPPAHLPPLLPRQALTTPAARLGTLPSVPVPFSLGAASNMHMLATGPGGQPALPPSSTFEGHPFFFVPVIHPLAAAAMAATSAAGGAAGGHSTETCTPQAGHAVSVPFPAAAHASMRSRTSAPAASATSTYASFPRRRRASRRCRLCRDFECPGRWRSSLCTSGSTPGGSSTHDASQQSAAESPSTARPASSPLQRGSNSSSANAEEPRSKNARTH